MSSLVPGLLLRELPLRSHWASTGAAVWSWAVLPVWEAGLHWSGYHRLSQEGIGPGERSSLQLWQAWGSARLSVVQGSPPALCGQYISLCPHHFPPDGQPDALAWVFVAASNSSSFYHPRFLLSLHIVQS